MYTSKLRSPTRMLIQITGQICGQYHFSETVTREIFTVFNGIGSVPWQNGYLL
jgi:hypothetical protein